jgi:hypothetical protein
MPKLEGDRRSLIRLFWYLACLVLVLGSPRKTASASRSLLNEKRTGGFVARRIQTIRTRRIFLAHCCTEYLRSAS